MADNTLSVKIGGRLISPALPVVDGQPSTKSNELSFNTSLQAFVKDNIPLESTDGIQTRERVLSRMGVLCRDWIKSVCRKRGLPKDVVDAAGGQLFTAGSYRLGIHEPGADIGKFFSFYEVTESCTFIMYGMILIKKKIIF
ncbi:MAG: poly(A) polymerase Pap1 [Bacillariaceae sp.]|jgi:poly(A) polymerase Pap1